MLNPKSIKSGSMKPGDGYVQSFARGLEVIKTFNQERPQQSLTEVAKHAGLTRAGARRILLTLVHLGYVENEGRFFRLTPKILDLGYAYLTSMPFWDAAEPIVESLVDRVKESSSISTLDGTDIVYVLRVPIRKIMTLNLSIGSRLPAALTSMGRVMLSDLDDEALEAHLQAFHAKNYSSALPEININELKAAIVQVRNQGWAMVKQELEAGLISIAAPIRDRNKRIIAAVNISGIADGQDAEKRMEMMLPSLLETSETISKLVARR